MPYRGPDRRRRKGRDYRTWASVGFALVALAVFVVVLDNIDARRDAALALERRDQALSDAGENAQKAAEISRVNSEQLQRLLDRVDDQDRQIAALRRQLENAGLTPVVVQPGNRQPNTTSAGNTSNSRPAAPSGSSEGARGKKPGGGTDSEPTPSPEPPPPPPPPLPPPSPEPEPPDETCILFICI